MSSRAGSALLAAAVLVAVFALGVAVGTRLPAPPSAPVATTSPPTAVDRTTPVPAENPRQAAAPAADPVAALRQRFDAAVAAGRAGEVAALGRSLILEYRQTGPAVVAAVASASVTLARAAAARGDLAATQRHLDAADEVLGGSVDRTLLRATLLRDAGHLLEAARAIQDARYWWNLEDRRLQALQRRCFLEAVAAADSGAAVALLEEAIEYDPTYADYHARLGRLLETRGRYADAVAALDRAATLDPALAAELEPLLFQARFRAALPPSVRITVQRAGETTLVPVTINGDRRLTFVLDTGSSYTALSRAALQALGAGAAPARGSVRLATANGVVEAPRVALASVAVGAAVVPAIDAVVLDDFGPHDGLLGMNYLRHFEVELSSRDGELLLRRR